MQKKILLVGESWTSTSTHVKGFDQFATATWHTGATDFLAALADSPYAITYMPAHAAATDFPLTLEALQEWDAIVLSDIGANTLLLHPDKNDHPYAATAFEAASSASKRLQDGALRAVVHRELEEMKDMEALSAAVSREERARQWKIARGEAVETAHVPDSRQEWMTKVPEKGDPLANIDLGASRSFSARP